jgi:hypothetical protein
MQNDGKSVLKYTVPEQNLARYHPHTNQCPHHPPFYLLGVLKAYMASIELKRNSQARL